MQSLFDPLATIAAALVEADRAVPGANASQTQLLVFVLLAFPVFFGGIWCGVVVLLSFVGGWRRLGKRFPARGPASGAKFSMQYGMMGMVSYKRVLTIHTSAEGIHLSIFPLFRPGHPPLFIPWNEIHDAQAQHVFWWKMVKFDVGSPPIATVKLPEKVFEGQTLEGLR